MARRWHQDPWVWLFGAIGVGGIFIIPEARFAVLDVFKRGRKLSYGELGDYGIITEDPENLRVAASQRYGRDISRDVYAAARMVRSEGASQPTLRVHVALNDLKAFPYADTLFDLLTYSTDRTRRGLYGKQFSPAVPPEYPEANRRRYSTSGNPYVGDVNAVIAAIAEYEAGADRAMGASKFIDVASMAVQEGSRSFETVNAEWVADGYKPFTTEEFGPGLVLYRKA